MGLSATAPVFNEKRITQAHHHPASSSVTFCHLQKNCTFLTGASQALCGLGEWGALTLQSSLLPMVHRE